MCSKFGLLGNRYMIPLHSLTWCTINQCLHIALTYLVYNKSMLTHICKAVDISLTRTKNLTAR